MIEFFKLQKKYSFGQHSHHRIAAPWVEKGKKVIFENFNKILIPSLVVVSRKALSEGVKMHDLTTITTSFLRFVSPSSSSSSSSGSQKIPDQYTYTTICSCDSEQTDGHRAKCWFIVLQSMPRQRRLDSSWVRLWTDDWATHPLQLQREGYPDSSFLSCIPPSPLYPYLQ